MAFFAGGIPAFEVLRKTSSLLEMFVLFKNMVLLVYEYAVKSSAANPWISTWEKTSIFS